MARKRKLTALEVDAALTHIAEVRGWGFDEAARHALALGTGRLIHDERRAEKRRQAAMGAADVG